MKILFLSIATVFTSIALCSPTYAANLHQSCKQDAQTYCNGVQPGQGRIINCLQDHYKQLSDDCYTALQQREKKKDANSNGAAQGGNNGETSPPRSGDNNSSDTSSPAN